MKLLFDKMLKFWKCVQDDIEPELCDRDYKLIRNSEILEDLRAWKETKDNLTILEKRLEVLKEKILSHSDIKGRRTRCGDFKINVTTRKGNVQYNKIPELTGVDLDKYRGKPTSYQTIAFSIKPNKEKEIL